MALIVFSSLNDSTSKKKNAEWNSLYFIRICTSSVCLKAGCQEQRHIHQCLDSLFLMMPSSYFVLTTSAHITILVTWNGTTIEKAGQGNAVLCKFKNSLKSVKKTGFFWVFLKLLYLVLVSKELFFLSSIPVDFYIQMCFLTVLWGHQEGRKDMTMVFVSK